MKHWPRAVTVHGYTQAIAALSCSARSPDRAITLLSGRAAAVYGGIGWWRAMVKAAQAACPLQSCVDILDCADASGAAMAALRYGQSALVLDPACPAFAAVQGAAAGCGGKILAQRPPSLDLSAPDATARLGAWLAADDSGADLR